MIQSFLRTIAHGRRAPWTFASSRFCRGVLLSSLGLCLALLQLPLSYAQPSPTGYTVARFGTLFDPGSSTVLRRMNLSQEIVGAFRKENDTQRAHSAFLLSRSGFVYVADTNDTSAAHGINNQGEVVGVVNTPSASRPFRALRLGTLEPLALPPGHTGGAAMSINEKGEAVGHVSGAAGVQPVWWSRHGDVYPLASLAGTTLNRALGINDAGDVVGVAGDGQKQAILWRHKAAPIAIGTLPGYVGSEAANVNNRGEIVGYAIGHASSPMRTRAVLWSRGGEAIQDLGALPGGDESRARDINASGVVVGTSSVAHGNRAFVWTEADGIVDLNTLIQVPGLVLTDAISVNQRGDIVALAYEVSVGARGGDHEHAHEDHELPRHIVVLTKAP